MSMIRVHWTGELYATILEQNPLNIMKNIEAPKYNEKHRRSSIYVFGPFEPLYQPLHINQYSESFLVIYVLYSSIHTFEQQHQNVWKVPVRKYKGQTG